MWPSPLTLTRNEVHVFDPPKDNNCLFQSFIHKIEDLRGVNKISTEKVKAMRCQLMDYIHENMNSQHPFNELLTWREIAEVQLRKADQSFMTCENYLHVMRSATPGDHSTMWGGDLEIQVFAYLYSVNVAVYRDGSKRNTYDLTQAYDGNLEDQSNVLFLLHTNNNTHYKVLTPLTFEEKETREEALTRKRENEKRRYYQQKEKIIEEEGTDNEMEDNNNGKEEGERGDRRSRGIRIPNVKNRKSTSSEANEDSESSESNEEEGGERKQAKRWKSSDDDSTSSSSHSDHSINDNAQQTKWSVPCEW